MGLPTTFKARRIGFLLEHLLRTKTILTGNDLSATMRAIAQTKTGLHITADDAQTLPTHQESYATILAANILYYVTEKKNALLRWEELLVPNGKLLLMEEYPFKQPTTTAFSKQTTKLIQVIHPVSPSNIINLLEQTGYELTQQLVTPIDVEHNLHGYLCKKKRL